MAQEHIGVSRIDMTLERERLTLALSVGPGDEDGLALGESGGGADRGGGHSRSGRKDGGNKDGEFEHGKG